MPYPPGIQWLISHETWTHRHSPWAVSGPSLGATLIINHRLRQIFIGGEASLPMTTCLLSAKKNRAQGGKHKKKIQVFAVSSPQPLILSFCVEDCRGGPVYNLHSIIVLLLFVSSVISIGSCLSRPGQSPPRLVEGFLAIDTPTYTECLILNLQKCLSQCRKLPPECLPHKRRSLLSSTPSSPQKALSRPSMARMP